MYEKLNPKNSAGLHTANSQLPMCAKTLQSSRNFPIGCAKLIAKNSHKFPVEFAKLCKMSRQCAFDCAKTLQKLHSKFPILCAIGCPESFSEHLVKFSFFKIFSEKRKQEQQSYGCMWWEIFFLQKLLKFYFSKNSKTLLPPSNFRDPCTRPGHHAIFI
jgi:hypothetical protein